MSIPIEIQSSIHHLNILLRGEYAADESYGRALEHEPAQSIAALRENRESHATRIRLLIQAIQDLGGIPDTSSGTWGSIASLVTGGAAVFGIDAVLALLEEGETRRLTEYTAVVADISPETQHLIDHLLLPAQICNLQIIKDLYKHPPAPPGQDVASTVSGGSS